MTIRGQMILVLGGVALLPLLAAGFILQHLSSERLLHDANNRLLAQTARVASQIDAFLYRSVENARQNSFIPAITDFVQRPPAERARRAASVIQVMSMVIIEDPINVTSCALLDYRGTVLADTASSAPGVSEAEAPWFLKPIATGLPGAVLAAPPGRPAALWVSAPLRNSGGDIIGVLRLRYERTVLKQLAATATEAASVATIGAIFDESSQVLAQSEGFAPDWQPGLTPELLAPETDKDGHAAFWAQWSKNAATSAARDRVAIVPLTRQPWRVALAQPEEIFLAPIHELRRTLLIFAALMALLAVVAVLILAHRLTRPVVLMARAAQQVSDGDLAALVPEDGLGEMGAMARAFNHMTRRLRSTLADRDYQIAALRVSEERYRLLLDHAPEAVVVLDVELGRFVDCNASAERLFKLSRENLFTYGPVDLSPATQPDGSSSATAGQAHIAGALAGGRPVFEWTHRDAEGHDLVCEIRLFRLPDPVRPLVRASIVDITERNAAEAALRRSETQLSEVFEHTRDLIFLLNVLPDGRFAYERLNRRAEQLAGRTTAEMRGRPIGEILSPAVAAVFIDRNQRCVATRAPVVTEETLALAKGTVTLHTTLVPIMDETGAVRRIAGFAHDVTESRRQQALLEQAEQAAHVGSWELDCATRRMFWSPETYRIFGLPETFDPSQGASRAFLVDEDRTRVATALDHAIATGEGYDLTVRIVTPSGVARHVRSICQAKMDHGRVSTLYGACQDVTAQVEAEESIRRLNAELESRVADRTAQLAAANAELEAFSYSVSHDLRSPLRAIDGFSRALEEDFNDRFDETGRDYLRRIRAGSQRMGLLIDDLLRLSQASRAEIHRTKVDLSKIAEVVAAEQRSAEPDRTVDFVCAPGLTAYADPQLIRIVFDNLLGNAWKYTRHQPAPRIEFGPAETTDGQAAKVFRVRDNGAGFDLRYAGKLFGAFQRLHSATEFDGTGIGLATVRRIVTRHGGNVWVETAAPGLGASFCFTLGEIYPKTNHVQ